MDIDELIDDIRETMPSSDLDPHLVNYWQMANERIFYLDTDITTNVLELQKHIISINIADKDLETKDRKPIVIMIDTNGGWLNETLCLCSTIMMSKTPVYTVNVCEALSGGALILMAGHKRFAMPYSVALIHSGSGGTYGTHEQTIAQQNNYNNRIKVMRKYILERTGMNERMYKKHSDKEWYLSAEEQVENGLVDYIVTSLEDLNL